MQAYKVIMSYKLGAFHLVRTHLGECVCVCGGGGVKSPMYIHFRCVLHAKRGGGGPDSM